MESTNPLYIVKIDDFEGPLDLLLHLVKESKVDIYDLSLTEITSQYVAYIQQMQSLNLEVASEYLFMAAQLIEMKSRWLLPKPPKEENGEESLDPREQLILRLIAYKQFKDISQHFRLLEEERQQYHTKSPEDISDWTQEQIILDESSTSDVYQLMVAFEKLMQRKELHRNINATIQVAEVSIDEQMTHIRKKLAKGKRVAFSELFEANDRVYLVTTFLAILQLSREHLIEIQQDANFADIFIEGKEAA